MFTRILILAACGLVATADYVRSPQLTPVGEIFTQCAKESGFDPDLSSSELEIIEGCTMACTMKKVGTMTEDGVWKAEQIIDILPKETPKYEEYSSAFRLCAKQSGKTDCETANLIRQCLIDNMPCEHAYECQMGSYYFMAYTEDMLPSNSEEDFLYDESLKN